MSQPSKKPIDFDPLSNKVIGAALAVHREMGAGFLELTYQRALAIELQQAGIPFQREVDIPIYYRDTLIDTRRADFVVDGIILELKAVDALLEEHAAQLLMYLKATRFKIGLLLNFGTPKLQIRRLVN